MPDPQTCRVGALSSASASRSVEAGWFVSPNVKSRSQGFKLIAQRSTSSCILSPSFRCGFPRYTVKQNSARWRRRGMGPSQALRGAIVCFCCTALVFGGRYIVFRQYFVQAVFCHNISHMIRPKGKMRWASSSASDHPRHSARLKILSVCQRCLPPTVVDALLFAECRYSDG